MYDVLDCLYFDRWNKLENVPGISYKKTYDFYGVHEKLDVLVTDGGDLGIKYREDEFFKYFCGTNLWLHHEFTSISEGIKYWFCTNLNADIEKHELLPLGVHNENSIENINKNLGNEKTDLVYCNFNFYSSPKIRERCWHECNKLGFCKMEQKIDDVRYYENLSRCKFSICPVGNGIDSYRIWESLYLGIRPIVQESAFARNLAKNFPVYIVPEYKYLIKESLENEKFANLEDYKEKLKMSYWVDRIKSFS